MTDRMIVEIVVIDLKLPDNPIKTVPDHTHHLIVVEKTSTADKALKIVIDQDKNVLQVCIEVGDQIKGLGLNKDRR